MLRLPVVLDVRIIVWNAAFIGGIEAASDAVFSDAEIDRTSGANMTAQIAMQTAPRRN